MRPLTKRESIVAILCGVLASAYFAIYVVTKPFTSHKEELVQQIDSKKVLLQKYVQTIHEAKGLESQYQKFLDDFRQRDTNEQVMSQLLSQIEKQSADLGLRISDLKPRRVKKEGFYNRFSVSLSLDSTLDEIMKLVYTFQTEPFFFYVDEISIEKGMQRENDTVKTRLVLSKILIAP